MKKILFLVAAAVFAVGTLSAQVPGGSSAGRSNGDTKVFGIELGTGFAYNIDTKAASPTQTVSAIFGLTDAVQAGFSVIKGNALTNSFTLVKLAVYPISDLSVQLSFGADQAAAPVIVSGFGIGYNVFKNNGVSGLTTALQGNIQYLFNDVAKGNLAIGMNLKVGL